MSTTYTPPKPPKQANVDELKAKLVDAHRDETPKDQRKAVTLVERPLSARYANNLNPPVGTSYWRSQSFVPMDGVNLSFTDWTGDDLVVETLTWRIDAYIYVVNARPDDDFARNGGAVYVVLVHGGSAATGALVGGGMEYRFTVTVRYPWTGASATKQLPPSNSGVHSGDDWNYPISFSQDMQMFKNGGNEPYTFQAGYEDSIDIYKGKQTGFVEDSRTVQWGVVLDNYPDFYSNFAFGGLSVFRFDSLDQFTFDCAAEVYSQAGSDGSFMAGEVENFEVNGQFSP